MKSRLNQEYKERKIELLRRIALCQENKEKIIRTIKNLNKSYDHGIISYEEYENKLNLFLKGKTQREWNNYYNESIQDYENQLKECDEKSIPFNLSVKNIMFIIFILLIIGSVIFLRPTITGLFVAEPTITYEDGYSMEGNQDRWADINGNMMYARCLKVKSEINFTQVEITGKLTIAQESNNLRLALYSNNNESDEPLEEIGNCRVKDYSTIWKSCQINLEQQSSNNYWICAYVPNGEKDIIYFTIAYQNGDNSKKRALWTGTNWQKLEKASFTLKSTFKGVA